jgi:hypothetical protein
MRRGVLRDFRLPWTEVDDEEVAEADEPEYCDRCHRYVSLEMIQRCEVSPLPASCMRAIARFEY